MSRGLIYIVSYMRMLTGRESFQRCVIRPQAAPRYLGLEQASSLNRNWENYVLRMETVVDETRWPGTP
jgi:hypothetical protein